MKIHLKKEETATITGHRPKFLPWGYNEDKQSCKNFKKEVAKIFNKLIDNKITTFLTGMAEGFDMIGTEILLELRKKSEIKIIAIVPCINQEIKWNSFQQRRYWHLLSQCDDVIILTRTYYNGCMNDRNKYMINNSSICIACYNGKSSGTENTVKYAKEKNNKLIIINPEKF